MLCLAICSCLGSNFWSIKACKARNIWMWSKVRSKEVIPSSSLPFILLWDERNPIMNKRQRLLQSKKWKMVPSYYSLKSHNLSNSLCKDSALRLSNSLFILSCKKMSILKTQSEARKEIGPEENIHAPVVLHQLVSPVFLPICIYAEQVSLYFYTIGLMIKKQDIITWYSAPYN